MNDKKIFKITVNTKDNLLETLISLKVIKGYRYDDENLIVTLEMDDKKETYEALCKTREIEDWNFVFPEIKYKCKCLEKKEVKEDTPTTTVVGKENSDNISKVLDDLVFNLRDMNEMLGLTYYIWSILVDTKSSLSWNMDTKIMYRAISLQTDRPGKTFLSNIPGDVVKNIYDLITESGTKLSAEWSKKLSQCLKKIKTGETNEETIKTDFLYFLEVMYVK